MKFNVASDAYINFRDMYKIYISFIIYVIETKIHRQNDIKIKVSRETRCNLLSNHLVASLMDNPFPLRFA